MIMWARHAEIRKNANNALKNTQQKTVKSRSIIEHALTAKINIRLEAFNATWKRRRNADWTSYEETNRFCTSRRRETQTWSEMRKSKQMSLRRLSRSQRSRRLSSEWRLQMNKRNRRWWVWISMRSRIVFSLCHRSSTKEAAVRDSSTDRRDLADASSA
jgi:hypothetical protein